MSLLIASFIAGVLTVAAPCILPLLPIVIGGSITGSNNHSDRRRWLRPLVIAVSLGVSVVAFTLLLKASTVLLGVPTHVWQLISGVIVISLGLIYLFPKSWSQVSSSAITRRLSSYIARSKQGGLLQAATVGAALGPVFNSCSPTYLLIVATVLPLSLSEGLIYLIAYALGLSLILLLIAYFGQRFVSRLGWLGSRWFERMIGGLFIVVGLMVIFGLDRSFQEFVLDQGWYAPISELETSLRQ